MVLLRRVIGDALRARRQAQHRTLREVSTAANVSLGYLSEIERGQKEASSELLAAICEALGAALSEVLRDVSEKLATSEEVMVPVAARPASAPAVAPAAAPEPEPVPAAASAGSSGPEARVAAGGPSAPEARMAVQPAASIVALAGRKLNVAVHRDGPLKTTLRATHTAQRTTTRDREPAYV
jgi:transcriptional regulator with XRE-family HTH domain